MDVVSRFRLSTRCGACKRVSTHGLDVPAAQNAPTDVDELLASAFLQRQRLTCKHCASHDTNLMGVTQVALPDAA